MAVICFEKGLRCKNCGKIIPKTDLKSRLCQGCGKQLIKEHKGNKVFVTEYADIVTIKKTCKFFRTIYEVVEVE